MAADVTVRGLDELSRRLNALADEFPEAQRELHSRLCEALQQKVRANLAGSSIDASGRLSGYQGGACGSRGGYAAVRPISGGNRRDSPGALTAYNENGHRIRRPDGGRRRKYRARIHTAYVGGRHFYARTRTDAEKLLRAGAEQLAKEFCERVKA